MQILYKQNIIMSVWLKSDPPPKKINPNKQTNLVYIFDKCSSSLSFPASMFNASVHLNVLQVVDVQTFKSSAISFFN